MGTEKESLEYISPNRGPDSTARLGPRGVPWCTYTYQQMLFSCPRVQPGALKNNPTSPPAAKCAPGLSNLFLVIDFPGGVLTPLRFCPLSYA